MGGSTGPGPTFRAKSDGVPPEENQILTKGKTIFGKDFPYFCYCHVGLRFSPLRRSLCARGAQEIPVFLALEPKRQRPAQGASGSRMFHCPKNG